MTHPKHPPAPARLRSTLAATTLALPTLLAGPALANRCPEPESHISPGDVRHDLRSGQPLPVVAPGCAITIYESSDDSTLLSGNEPATVVWTVDGAPIDFAFEQLDHHIVEQSHGCDIFTHDTIPRSWWVWRLVPDAPMPQGTAEILNRDESVIARFDVSPDAEGCADTVPPELDLCTVGGEECEEEPEPFEGDGGEPDAGEPDAGEFDAGLPEEDLPDGGPGADRPEGGDGGCSTFVDDPRWWPASLWLGLLGPLGLRRRRPR